MAIGTGGQMGAGDGGGGCVENDLTFESKKRACFGIGGEREKRQGGLGRAAGAGAGLAAGAGTELKD